MTQEELQRLWEESTPIEENEDLEALWEASTPIEENEDLEALWEASDPSKQPTAVRRVAGELTGIERFGIGMGRGASGVLQLGDRALGLVSENARKRAEQRSRDFALFDEQLGDDTTTSVGKVAGEVAASLVPGGLAANLIGRSIPVVRGAAQMIGRQAAIGAGGGAVSGGAASAIEASDEDILDLIGKTATGATVGGIVGGLGGATVSAFRHRPTGGSPPLTAPIGGASPLTRFTDAVEKLKPAEEAIDAFVKKGFSPEQATAIQKAIDALLNRGFSPERATTMATHAANQKAAQSASGILNNLSFGDAAAGTAGFILGDLPLAAAAVGGRRLAHHIPAAVRASENSLRTGAAGLAGQMLSDTPTPLTLTLDLFSDISNDDAAKLHEQSQLDPSLKIALDRMEKDGLE